MQTPRTIQWIGDSNGFVRLIDQTLLPTVFEYRDCHTVEEVWEAIRSLRVRGAPAIGIAAAYGVVLGLQPWLREPGSADRDIGGAAADIFGEARHVLEPAAHLLAVEVDRGAADRDDVELPGHRPLRHRMVGMTKSAPWRMPVGQRVVMVFIRV